LNNRYLKLMLLLPLLVAAVLQVRVILLAGGPGTEAAGGAIWRIAEAGISRSGIIIVNMNRE